MGNHMIGKSWIKGLGIAMAALLLAGMMVLAGCSSGQASSSGTSGSSATTSSSSSQDDAAKKELKAKYVGTWELTESTNSGGGLAFDPQRIEALHQHGRETFMNMTDEGTITFNYAGSYMFGVWEPKDDSTVTIQLGKTEATDVNCDGSNLSFTAGNTSYKFTKGEPKSAPFLFEYQEWYSPFIGDWHIVSAARGGEAFDVPADNAHIKLSSDGLADFTFQGEENPTFWMATSTSSGVLYLEQPYALSIEGSRMSLDLAEGNLFYFERD